MGKDSKKPAETKAAVETKKTTEENVMDDLREMNLQNEKSVEAAMADLDKETDEKKKEEAKCAIRKHQYKNARALLELRRRRGEDKVTKEYLNDTKETLDQFLAGKLTRTEADEKDKNDEKKKNEGMRKVSDEYNKGIRELKNAYTEYYCYDWDRCW